MVVLFFRMHAPMLDISCRFRGSVLHFSGGNLKIEVNSTRSIDKNYTFDGLELMQSR